MVMKINEEIEKTVKLLDELSLNEEERELYESREKALRDYISGMTTSKNEGLVEGEKNAKLEVAKKMLEKKIPLETIIRITGLSKEEIMNIV